MLGRFQALDFFNEIQVYGRGLGNLAGLHDLKEKPARRDDGRRDPSSRANRTPTRILDDAGIKEMAAIGVGVAYVEPV